MTRKLYTVGHSNHGIATFIDLLKMHKVTATGDVRSHPYSRYNPQFSKNALQDALAAEGIAYIFLGDELGARSKNPACYKHGRVQYERLAQEPGFLSGLERIGIAMDSYTIALMCAEKDPIECHRAVLVGRRMFEKGIDIAHIHGNGAVETQVDFETRLLKKWHLHESDMFNNREDSIKNAYSLQGDRIAYQDEKIGHDNAS